MKNAGYAKEDKQVKKVRKILSREPLHIKEILPEVMHDIRLRMSPGRAGETERSIR
jgi:hypothetical protein